MDQTHLTSLTELLLQRGLHIATAESCTLGGVASTLGSHSGASAYLQGGIIAYQSDLKTSLLGVPPELIETYIGLDGGLDELGGGLERAGR